LFYATCYSYGTDKNSEADKLSAMEQVFLMYKKMTDIVGRDWTVNILLAIGNSALWFVEGHSTGKSFITL